MNVMNKTVLVSGAGGSIGSEIVRQIRSDKTISKLIINDISELSLFTTFNNAIENLSKFNKDLEVIPVLGDIGLDSTIQLINKSFSRINNIYHAAAYKHVGLSMTNPLIYYKNNINATDGVIKIAKETDAQIVHISTDKAVYPCNHMGYSKRICEFLYFRNIDKKLAYKIVRFGNVLNSSGSVIPIFKNQIKTGGPVTVTDPDATRFFMSIAEAVGLVLDCHKTPNQFKINVLDMGPPQLIDRLAKNLIEQAGFSVVTDDLDQDGIKIEYIGLRDGEKLHETLSYLDVNPTGIPNINYAEENTEVCEYFLSKLLEGLWSSKFELLKTVNWSKGEFL